MTLPSVRYTNGRFYSAAEPRATAMLVRGGTIAWLGDTADAPAADRTVDLDGALVTPAFVDAHLHVTDTGLAADGLELSGVRSAGELLAAVERFARTRPAGAVVHGQGWDESTWTEQRLPTAAELDRAAAGRRVYLTQASVHSALVSAALLPAAEGVDGYDPSGWVREHAHHAVRAVALGSLSPEQRTDAQRTALRTAAAAGIAAVHECGGPGTSSEADFQSVLRLSGQNLPEVYGFWGELGGADKARELGAHGAAGDLYADGALGSRTASLRTPYRDGDHGCGEAFLTAEQVAEHLLDCIRVGFQGGFHAIGDAAIATVLEGFALAAKQVGVDRIREGNHRIEHVELIDKAMIARMVEFGVTASVQPVFDALWGGADRMYAQRLGADRALASNPIGAMHATGVALAFGSDSPVTALDPWSTVVAAIAPRNPVYRMKVRAAFAAASRGGWRAAGISGAGVLAPGASATFAAWDTPGGLHEGLPALLPDVDGAVPARPVCRRTVLHGDTIHEI
ncbi:amidohydrolase [Actinoplanes sp. SE50]|uniref:amidohydrolase n=1 Tax=unclassified Actinoplanes TaxID=2626549 RepID=UPI00023EC93D|nr:MULTISPECIES: amidohydrolase family protein [unclassified Actinoplanes]AEV83699.1 Putative amidohydrolase ytcJ [Actinoplanes sp. SE50/110]ATO82157.1 amidohydrolase [Actinoplanes sp. SE50]SLL99564.1 amidohydrolase [Actinoplanes sp. SE50/110]